MTQARSQAGIILISLKLSSHAQMLLVLDGLIRVANFQHQLNRKSTCRF